MLLHAGLGCISMAYTIRTYDPIPPASKTQSVHKLCNAREMKNQCGCCATAVSRISVKDMGVCVCVSTAGRDFC